MAGGDELESRAREMSGLEKFYHDNFVIGIVLSVCCSLVGLILSGIAYTQSKNEKAKNNAMVCMIIAVVLMVGGFALRFTGALAQLGGR